MTTNTHTLTHTLDAGGWQQALPAELLATQDAALISWLSETSSLTQRVQSLCNEAAPFNLQLIQNELDMPHRDEAKLLGSSGRVHSREVVLRRGDTALIFAHSIVGRGDLKTAWASMNGIGKRSLGSVLFSDPTVVRGTLHYHGCTPGHLLYQKAILWCAEDPPVLWARRACFMRDNRPLIVTEVFLPALLTL